MCYLQKYSGVNLENIHIKVSQCENVIKSRKCKNEATIAAMNEASEEEDVLDEDTNKKQQQ